MIPFPDKKYQIIYADPPWRQTKGGLRKIRPKQNKELPYKTLSLKKIERIIAHFNSPTLFLWTIDKFLFEAQNIAENLNYKLHARLIWDKENGVAPCFTVRYSHEYLLWFYRSPMVAINKTMRGKFTTVLREKSSKHSKKPICAYQLIEQLYPTLTKVELFAREHRDGWDAWGDEV